MRKKRIKLVSGLLVLIAGLFLLTPTYIREALIHWYPDITDTYIFSSHTVERSSACREWPEAPDYNTFRMNETDEAYLFTQRRCRKCKIRKNFCKTVCAKISEYSNNFC